MKDIVKVAKALSDPVRYKIMLMLARSEEVCCPVSGETENNPGLCNCEIMAKLGMIQSRVSYHMKELVEAGLVTEEPRGKWKMYFIKKHTFKQFMRQLGDDFRIN